MENWQCDITAEHDPLDSQVPQHVSLASKSFPKFKVLKQHISAVHTYATDSRHSDTASPSRTHTHPQTHAQLSLTV